MGGGDEHLVSTSWVGTRTQCAADGRGDVPRRSRQLICVECSNEQGRRPSNRDDTFRPWTRSWQCNRDLWDEWTGIHERSEFYELAAFRAGGVRLADYELEQIGDVHGRSLLHLQCHFGIDTLSLARLGAT